MQIARLNNLVVSDSLKGKRNLRLPDIPPTRIGGTPGELPALVAAAAPEAAAPAATAPARAAHASTRGSRATDQGGKRDVGAGATGT